MSTFRTFWDGLANALSGAGTSADRREHSRWNMRVSDPAQIEAAYRSSWLARKAVDLPPADMTREWRDWQAEAPQIEALEAEERRLDLRTKVRQALTFGRLGGGAIILGVAGSGNTRLPINTRTISKGGLRYVHVVSRWQIAAGDIEMDPESDWFGQPKDFTLNAKGGGQVVLHPSRVICFRGLPSPRLHNAGGNDEFWGDSILQAIDDAIKNAEMASNGFASLIDKASISTFKVPGLGEKVSTTEMETRFSKRLDLLAQAASSHRMEIIDGEETIEHRQIVWNGMPEIIKVYLAIVAGATDIPATRLLGKAPDGMNSTGEGDERNYYQMIGAKQSMDLAPALDRIDAALIPSALGSKPDNVYYSFSPLWQMSEQDAATVMKTKAEAVKIYADSNLVPEKALGVAVQNMLVEDGQLPGLEAALEDAAAELGEEPDEDEDDPSETAEERAARLELAANG